MSRFLSFLPKSSDENCNAKALKYGLATTIAGTGAHFFCLMVFLGAATPGQFGSGRETASGHEVAGMITHQSRDYRTWALLHCFSLAGKQRGKQAGGFLKLGAAFIKSCGWRCAPEAFGVRSEGLGI